MSALVELTPGAEVLLLADVKNWLRVTTNADDTLIDSLITAARIAAEAYTARAIALRTFRQSLDAPPYYVDSMMSQLAMPPSYYALPPYSTTLWNYSQMIKLYNPPLLNVESIKYTAQDNSEQTIDPANYIVDADNEPARIFPQQGQFWPPVRFVPNALRIVFDAGYSLNPSLGPLCPESLKVAMMMLVSNYYEHREASEQGTFGVIPNHVQHLLYAHKVMDVAQTRG